VKEKNKALLVKYKKLCVIFWYIRSSMSYLDIRIIISLLQSCTFIADTMLLSFDIPCGLFKIRSMYRQWANRYMNSHDAASASTLHLLNANTTKVVVIAKFKNIFQVDRAINTRSLSREHTSISREDFSSLISSFAHFYIVLS